MRFGVTIGLVDGKWEAIALPDTSLDQQKRAVKDSLRSGGKLPDGRKIELLLHYDTPSKRKLFKPLAAPAAPEPAPAAPEPAAAAQDQDDSPPGKGRKRH